MDVKNLDDVPAFTTKDGSEIRELLAHRNSVIRNQSLAEARVPVGGSTLEHYHAKTEEIYYITAGAGRMRALRGSGRLLPRHCDPAGPKAQNLEHGKRTAQIALLLRAGL